jgi:hypothetical protein
MSAIKYEYGKSPVAQVRAALVDNHFRLLLEFFPHLQGTDRFRFYTSRTGRLILTQEFLNGHCEVFQPVVDSHDLGTLLNTLPTL